jgi:TonB family protein
MPLLVSGLFHVVCLVHFSGSTAPQTSPLGYWVEMAPVSSPSTTAASPQIRHRNLDKESVEEASALPTPSSVAPSAPVGNAATGSGVEGPLGEADGALVSIRDRYLYELEAFLNSRKVYPIKARHLGLSGRVEIAFHLEADGKISDPHIVRPCIHDVLNEAALRLVQGMGNYRPLPTELKLAVLHVTVPILYELN